jgi:riboflavin synthase
VFTGIVEEMGRILSKDGDRVRFAASKVLEGSGIGSSIAVDGCCLTLVATDSISWWEAEVSAETLSRTTLGEREVGSTVNLERPLALGERLGGHLVLGHVDATGVIVSPAPDLCVRIPAPLTPLLVEKGSVTVDGVSLTAFDIDADTFRVAVVPHTAAITTLGVRKAGDRVNIEMDMLAKHVARLVEPHSKRRRWWQR